MKHFIGIDNSSLDHKIQIIDSDGNCILKFTIINNLSGFEKLDKKISQFEEVLIGLELPHGPIIDYLKEKGYKLYSLNPLKIKRFKETIKVSGNKNDYIDASAIAEYLCKYFKHVRPLLSDSSEIEKLKIFRITHNRLTGEHSRYINKLHFIIKQYFGLHETLFSHFGCTVQLKMIIKYPTLNDLRVSLSNEFIQFLKQNKYRNSVYIKKIIEKIKDYNQFIPPEIEYPYQYEAKAICEILLLLKEKIKYIEDEMGVINNNHRLGKYFRSLPGAGKILSSKLLSIFGDNKNRFENANNAQCLFGTAPRNHQSGTYHKVIMRRACNKSARAMLYQFAFSSMRFSPWAREYYDGQREKGKSHSVAVRALSNKWVKIIFKIWKDEIIYEEEKKILPAA